MNTLGIYIYNATQRKWLQDDEKTWGDFTSAQEFTEGNEELAEDIRLRETKDDDVTYVMVAQS